MEKEREGNIDVREKHQSVVSPTTQACALTGNWTGDPSGSQAGVQSTEPHQPGPDMQIFKELKE